MQLCSPQILMFTGPLASATEGDTTPSINKIRMAPADIRLLPVEGCRESDFMPCIRWWRARGSFLGAMEPTRAERRKLDVYLGSHIAEDRLTDESRAGNPEAFERLFRDHYEEAMRIAGWYVVSNDEAEDIVQASFVKAWRGMDGFRSGAPFGPWIRAVVANEARSHLRARSRRASAEERLEQQVIRSASPEPSPEDIHLSCERRAEIDQAMGALRSGDRHVIRLRYEMGLSESEMAEKLEVPSGTVKSRLSRALARLREHMVILILVLIVVGVATVPPVRAAVERLLGIAGGEKVISVPELPERISPRPFAWGPVVNPGKAGVLNPFGEDLPVIDGAEPELRLRSDLNRSILTFIYGNDTISIMGGRGPLVLAKLLPPGSTAKPVQTTVGEGIWLSGVSHALATLDPNGRFTYGPKTRIDANVLALSGSDGRDYRVQTEGNLEHAVELVETFLLDRTAEVSPVR